MLAAPPFDQHREEVKNAIYTNGSLADHSKVLLQLAIEQAPSIEGLLKLKDADGVNVDFIREVIRMPVCKTCRPPRLPLLEFRQLTWLPDPQFTDAAKEHYKAFDDIFGQDTVEVDRPGAKTQENKSGKAYFTKEKVGDAVECESCGKWRCVYAPTKPPRASKDQFHQAVDTLMYTCGALILPEGHPVAEIFIVCQDISCSDPVEKQYYSCKNFDLICCRCGSTEPDALVNKEMKCQYKVVNPVCRACLEKGAEPVVSALKTVTASTGKKKKKP